MKKSFVVLIIIGGVMLWARAMADTGEASAGEAKKEEKPVPAYKGSSPCKMCHKVQYESWSKSRMANALESLKPGAFGEEKKKVGLDPEKDYTSDPNCLSCHTTGYKKPGGYVDQKTTPSLGGITCEACHGPSSLWLKEHMKSKDHKIVDLLPLGFNYPGSIKDCQNCHNEKSPFNEKVDKKYALKYDKDTLTRAVHQHEILKNDHGQIKGSLFQVKEEEKK
ncbi:MAG: cytochrome c family protein [bacterium JZ-2024 1]